MFRNSHFDRLTQLFSDQFEQDDAGYLYRRGMKDSPIRVTATERDGFVAAYRRHMRYAAWATVPATVGLILVLAMLMPDANGPYAHLIIYTGLGAILAPFLFVQYWARNAPARALEGRSRVGKARTSEEMRRLQFARMTYGQLCLAAVVPFLLILKVSAGTDVFRGWGLLWWVVAGMIMVGAVIQAFRKWWFERR